MSDPGLVTDEQLEAICRKLNGGYDHGVDRYGDMVLDVLKYAEPYLKADFTADEWEAAARYQESLDLMRRVTINPKVRFGRPAVGGISVDAIVELAQSGESEEDIAQTFGLPLEGVRAALTYSADLKSCIWVDPGRQSGEACFGGTRVPVDPFMVIVEESGAEAAKALWPSVTDEHVIAGIAWRKRYRELSDASPEDLPRT